jgi:alkanesulfonate monooxygenase SsuD/methylene tetrahydromethanopterin reductase-like flavin-dependent oxidoreductase (luciferase family)
LWQPVLVAEQIGTLAAIAQGPFIMQCGIGWGEARFAAMGANIRTRPSAFEEALDIVRRLLAGETVSSARRFRIAEAIADCWRQSLHATGPPEFWRADRVDWAEARCLHRGRRGRASAAYRDVLRSGRLDGAVRTPRS